MRPVAIGDSSPAVTATIASSSSERPASTSPRPTRTTPCWCTAIASRSASPKRCPASAEAASSALVAAQERGQRRQVAALDAVAVAQQPLGAGEPAARLGGLAAQRQEQPEPERAADGRLDRAGLHMGTVRPLEHGQVLGLVAEHVGGQGQPLEIVAAELAGRRQRHVGVLPRPSSDGLAAALHVIGGVHPPVS